MRCVGGEVRILLAIAIFLEDIWSHEKYFWLDLKERVYLFPNKIATYGKSRINVGTGIRAPADRTFIGRCRASIERQHH